MLTMSFRDHPRCHDIHSISVPHRDNEFAVWEAAVGRAESPLVYLTMGGEGYNLPSEPIPSLQRIRKNLEPHGRCHL